MTANERVCVLFDLRAARYFVAVAEELHFGKAAERLQMSQPPLSQAIRQLENDVGTLLFERTNRRVALTAAGSAFLPRCRDLLQQAAAAARVPQLAAQGVEATIIVGAVASALAWPLASALTRTQAAFPLARVQLREVDTHEVVSGLRDGSLDLALARMASARPGVVSTTLIDDEFVALLPEDHPHAHGAGPLDLRVLADDQWIWPDREVSPDYHDDMTSACRQSGFSPQATHRARSIASQTQQVSCGVGVTIVPATMTTALPPRVVRRQLIQGPRAVALAVSTRMTTSPAIERLKLALIEVARGSENP